MSVTISLPDTGHGPVGQLNTLSNQGAVIDTIPVKPLVKPPEPTPRQITWALKPTWNVGEEITKEALGLGVTAGDNNATLTSPAVAKLAMGGITVTVTAEAPAAGGFARAMRREFVTIDKLPTTITWKAPLAVALDTQLTATQLNAIPDPLGLALAYAPKATDRATPAGKLVLTVRFAGNDAQLAKDASVSLTVVATRDLATTLGSEMMLQGRAFDVSKLDRKAQAALLLYTADPPGAGKVQATKIMKEVDGLTGPELMKYMDDLIDSKTNPANKWVNDKTPSGIKDKVFPNVIWKLPNGLKVRYKPKGDGGSRGDTPMFCIEGIKDGTDFKDDQTSVAFKVMPNGDPGPKGPGDMVQTYDRNAGLVSALAATQYNDAACGLTHLACTRVADQVITWAGPGPIDVGTALTVLHLNATALGGVVPTYRDSNKQPVAAGQSLAGGDHVITALAAETLRYKAGTKPVTLTMKRKPQDLKWTGPAKMFADYDPGKKDVSVLGDPVLSFTLAGNLVDPTVALSRGANLDLIVRSALTPEYEAGEATVKVTVEKQEWEIEWENPPAIVEGEALTATGHLNATAEGATTLEYSDQQGNKIKAGSTLTIEDFGDGENTSAGQEQDLTVTIKASQIYNSTSRTVKIMVLPKPKAATKAKVTKPPAKGKKKGGQ